MKIAKKYYTRVTGEQLPDEPATISTGLRKTITRKRKSPAPKARMIDPNTVDVPVLVEYEDEITSIPENQYPDSVVVTVKREIKEIYEKLEFIANLKELEKPLQKRLRVLEKCYINLQELEVVPGFTLPPGTLEEPEEAMENILEAVRVPDNGVHNLSDFE